MTMRRALYRKIFFVLITLSGSSAALALALEQQNTTIFMEWTLGGAATSLTWTLLLDSIAALFLATVFFISSNVTLFRFSYIEEDTYSERFILIVFGFVLSMLLLIIRPNILSVLLGWDGLGLVSYCLVIYYSSSKASSAGILTVLSNRVGDICILIAIAYFASWGEFNFLFWESTDSTTSLLSLLVIGAAITKRAQIPFSAWLPAAIAAPTPVSALVHSSTLVTAGVYLLIRFSSFITRTTLELLTTISILTIFMAGLAASFEFDLKKVVALSTLSQLGVMMFSISVGLPYVAFFHLVTHALFKAILFLCAGTLIHGIQGSQDIRDLGGLISTFPLVGVCMNLANLSLCGVPFIAGFYSKDLLVELAAQQPWRLFLLLLLYSSLALTVFYRFRLTFFSFSAPITSQATKLGLDNHYTVLVPIFNLAALSLWRGPFLANMLLPLASLVLLPTSVKLATLTLILLIRAQAISTSLTSPSTLATGATLNQFHSLIWGLPFLSGQIPARTSITLSRRLFRGLDQGWLEWTTVKTSNELEEQKGWLQQWHLDVLRNHFLMILFWVCLLLLLQLQYPCSLVESVTLKMSRQA
jgi:NADH-ubiquinone oxidoreductase chain 5